MKWYETYARYSCCPNLLKHMFRITLLPFNIKQNIAVSYFKWRYVQTRGKTGTQTHPCRFSYQVRFSFTVLF